MIKLKKMKPDLAVRGRSGSHIAASTGNLNKTITMKPISTINLYEAVNHTIKVPDGLLNRGKYCGKS